MPRKNPIKLICPVCGKEFWSKRPKHPTQACSARCGAIKRRNGYMQKHGKPCHNSGTNREKAKQTCLERYNVENPSQLNEVKKKKEETCIKHYGKSYYFQTDEGKEKIQQTCLEKYGCRYASQSQEVKEKIEQTNLKKYGFKSHNSSEEVKQHKVESYLKNHGYAYNFQDPAVKERIKNTSLKRYGVENPGGSEIAQEKARQTKLERYGDAYYNNREKARQTLLANENYNTSEFEEFVYKLLLRLNYEIIRQYKSDKYPWLCDFYIKELDLYIEIQGFPSHGKKGCKVLGPYDKDNPEHQVFLKSWQKKAKTNEWYKSSIRVWTIEDPLKRETAKKNNLNWLEFFTVEEFILWYIELEK